MITYEDHTLLATQDHGGGYLGVYRLSASYMRDGYRWYSRDSDLWPSFVARMVLRFLGEHT